MKDEGVLAKKAAESATAAPGELRRINERKAFASSMCSPVRREAVPRRWQMQTGLTT